MKKLAFFVEGLTEQLFITKLLIEMAGAKDITIEDVQHSGKKGDPNLLKIIARSKTKNTKYYVLIVNCQGDSKVQSAVIDNHTNLVKQSYVKVLGLKDIYPHKYSDLPSLERGAKYCVPTKPIPTDVLLAVAETEAWFMAEYLHFEKIDSKLTPELIKKSFSHDLKIDDVEKIHHPTEEMYKIYLSVGKKYARKVGNKYIKSKKTISKTVKALDYTHLYVNVADRVTYLKKLINHIDSFLV